MTLPSITGEPTTRAPVGNFHFKRWNSRGPVPGYMPVCAALPRNIDCASAALIRERNRKRKGDTFITREVIPFPAGRRLGWGHLSIGRSSVAGAAKSNRNFERTLKNRSLDLALARSPFKTQPGLMRIDCDEFSLLHDTIDRQFIFLTPNDDELGGGSFGPAVLQFDCNLARITEKVIPAFPFALDLFCDRGTARRTFHLRRSSFLHRKWRGVSRLHEIAGQFPVANEVPVKLRRPGPLISERALNREGDVVAVHSDIT